MPNRDRRYLPTVCMQMIDYINQFELSPFGWATMILVMIGTIVSYGVIGIAYGLLTNSVLLVLALITATLFNKVKEKNEKV